MSHRDAGLSLSSVVTRERRGSSSKPLWSPGSRRRASTYAASGVLPTPAVAYLTDAFDADFGVMLSASHNPMPDNGIKFFARGGLKLEDDVEQAIEDAMTTAVVQPTGAGVGRVTDEADAERLLRRPPDARRCTLASTG